MLCLTFSLILPPPPPLPFVFTFHLAISWAVNMETFVFTPCSNLAPCFHRLKSNLIRNIVVLLAPHLCVCVGASRVAGCLGATMTHWGEWDRNTPHIYLHLIPRARSGPPFLHNLAPPPRGRRKHLRSICFREPLLLKRPRGSPETWGAGPVCLYL